MQAPVFHAEKKIHYRPDLEGSHMVIFDEVFTRDTYRLRQLSRLIEPVETCVDVGANMGVFPHKLWAHYPEARVVAIEPVPENQAVLKLNVEPRGVVVEAAMIYGQGPRVSIRLSGGCHGSSYVESLGRHPTTHLAQWGPTVEVRAVTLEEILDGQGWAKVDLLKLDCEGSEYSILTSADLSRVGCVVGEFHGLSPLLALPLGPMWRREILGSEGEQGVFRLTRR